MRPNQAYIIAARRTALGRVGGLHRQRRVADLAAPVIAAALADCGLDPARVDELIAGNASESGNPARLIALAAGLPEAAAAATIDRQCASGLDAILAAVRAVAAGDADVVVAGGAEALSTAPWRIAKPRNLYQLPHFVGIDVASAGQIEGGEPFEIMEALPRARGISRERQDAYSLKSHMRAAAARNARRFVGEIVPLRATTEEARDQSAVEPELDELEALSPFVVPDGTLTPGNTSAPHDGAAFVVVVSEQVWIDLGRPPALRLLASAAQGVAPGEDAAAPIEALRKLYGRLNGFDRGAIGLFEMSESSAAQALALADALGIDSDSINPDGGAIARGHPFGAAGAVLVVRLFTSMARPREATASPRYGVAALGAVGGLGVAALFERVAPAA